MTSLSPKEKKNYKEILRSSSIIGGAAVINIAIGLLRTKAAALLLGPTGIGMIGLLQSMMSAATTVFALGFGTVGARQIADAHGNENPEKLAVTRHVLFWGMLSLGIVGALFFWFFRTPIAEHLLNDPTLRDETGWLGIGVFLSIAAGSQGALLRGMRKIPDIARITIFSSLISVVIGVPSLWIWQSDGIILYILAAPLSSYFLGQWYVSRIEKSRPTKITKKMLIDEWRILAVSGTSFMITGVIIAGSHFAVRSIIKDEVGLAALGIFQAAWMISVTYLGFIITAMSNDYYPRLSAIVTKKEEANKAINQQIEIALLLSLPILLLMQSLAPLVIEILYSREFKPAVDVLRWQILGDTFKIISWPLGLVALASNDSKSYILTESAAIGIFLLATYLTISHLGIEAAGIAYFLMYLVYCPIVLIQTIKRTDFSYTPEVKKLLISGTILSIFIFLLNKWSVTIGSITGCLLGFAIAFYSLGSLWRVSHFGGVLGKIGYKCDYILKKINL